MSDTPLIFTARGNVPESDLRYEKEWLIEQQEKGQTIVWFHERWFFEDGALAKNNAHGYVVPKAAPRKRKPPPSRNDVTVGLYGAGRGGQQAAMS